MGGDFRAALTRDPVLYVAGPSTPAHQLCVGEFALSVDWCQRSPPEYASVVHPFAPPSMSSWKKIVEDVLRALSSRRVTPGSRPNAVLAPAGVSPILWR